MKKDLKFAVLIDADNIPYANIKGMMEEIAKYGIPTFKRIYGDWTQPTLKGWKTVLLENAITPVQQYSYTTGKNSTDSAMIIDAMDILYSGKVDGFCLVSSDSDFTRLAIRLRETGMYVIGMGEKKTPKPFIAACDKFVYLEIISSEDEPAENVSAQKNKKSKKSIYQADKKLINFISSSINDVADENGWAFLGEVGTLLLKKQPNFDPRNYGFQKLTPLIASLKKFEINERESDNPNIKLIYIRNKQ
ncbi:MAG: NYN domain-containing protein [Bacteroidota bacterium]|nr:NYN domain-containing protein [Bacteroidota bacterium]